MTAIEKLKLSLSKNEFRDFLEGKGEYNIMSKEGFLSDRAIALYAGIYEYYKLNPNSNIDNKFEKTLVEMLNGNEFDIVTSFDYFWMQIKAEKTKNSPFKFDSKSYEKLKNAILLNTDKLKSYKEFFEYGAQLQNGAYEYIEGIDKYFESEYGHKIL